MAIDLALPDGLAPSNLHLQPSIRTRFVSSDVLDICKRIAEISPRLFVVELTDPENRPDQAAWSVMEMCDDGVARQVYKYQELDQRILPHLQRMLAIPLEHRAQAAQDEIDRANAKMEADNIDHIVERMGDEFRFELHKNGFIDQRPVSYPKLGVASPRRVR